MSGVRIDRDVALGALSGVIEKFGVDHVYDSEGQGGCWYTIQNQDGDLEPACIVGQALWGLGVDPGVINSLNVAGLISNRENKGILEAAEVEVTDDAYYILQAAQSCQDQGEPWGMALQTAQDMYQVT